VITTNNIEKLKKVLQCHVAVIGNFRLHEFVHVVRDIGDKTNAIYFENIFTFLHGHENRRHYDLILLLESSFFQYSLCDFQKLQSLFPLTRIVLIAGSLAEGEKRTGNIPSNIFRYYWHQWSTEASQQLMTFCRNSVSVWNLPKTSTDEERLTKTLSTQKNRNRCQYSSERILIVASDPAMREFLAIFSQRNNSKVIAINSYGLEKYVENFNVVPTEILFDVVDEDFDATLEIVKYLRQQWSVSATRLTLYYNAPRADEIRSFTDSGVQRVISKPFFLS
jgi:CheY-like chemotaxis protein